jgi:hypothetical protein
MWRHPPKNSCLSILGELFFNPKEFATQYIPFSFGRIFAKRKTDCEAGSSDLGF